MAKKTWGLIITVLFLFALYIPLDSPRGVIYNFKTPIDDLIVLNTKFLVVYLSYFVYLVFTICYFVKIKQINILNQILLSVAVTAFFSYLFFIFFQNSVDRPIISPHDFFDLVYVWINQNIPEYNAFPSLHVAISTICLLGFIKIKSNLALIIAIWTVLIYPGPK